MLQQEINELVKTRIARDAVAFRVEQRFLWQLSGQGGLRVYGSTDLRVYGLVKSG